MKSQIPYMPIGPALVCVLLFVAGCTMTATPTANNASMPSGRTDTPISAAASLTPSPTQTVETTSPATVTLLETATIKQTATTTPSPLATLPPDQAQKLIVDLLQNNAGCKLPCWWGFVPGQTTWTEARNLLATIATKIVKSSDSRRPLYTVYLPVPEDIHPGTRLIHEYRVQEGLIEMVEVGLGSNSQNYSLPEFLASYGQPDEVWIRTFDEPRDNVLPFYVALFYPRKGILVRYFDNAAKDGDRIRGCPQREEYWPLLWLWSPEQTMSFMEIAAQTATFGLDEEKAFLPLERSTGMDVVTFYETFKRPENQSCLETSANLWSPPV